MTNVSDSSFASSSEAPTRLHGMLQGLGDRLMGGLAFGAALIAAAIPFCIILLLLRDAAPAISKFGLSFLWLQDWDIANEQFGALPYLYGTLVSSCIALILALPVGVAVAILTSERVLPEWLQWPIAFLVELIAAIPSVIVGLWGRFILIPALDPLQLFLYNHFKWIPLFNSQPFGSSMLVAGMVLAIMILPTIAAISRDVFLALSQDLRNAAFALGATQWECIVYVTVPAAASGILGGATLGLGRALGETMAVTMVIGNVSGIDVSLLSPGSTIPSLLANQFAEATETLHLGALMYLALVLFLVTLMVNTLAVLMIRILGR